MKNLLQTLNNRCTKNILFKIIKIWKFGLILRFNASGIVCLNSWRVLASILSFSCLWRDTAEAIAFLAGRQSAMWFSASWIVRLTSCRRSSREIGMVRWCSSLKAHRARRVLHLHATPTATARTARSTFFSRLVSHNKWKWTCPGRRRRGVSSTSGCCHSSTAWALGSAKWSSRSGKRRETLPEPRRYSHGRRSRGSTHSQFPEIAWGLLRSTPCGRQTGRLYSPREWPERPWSHPETKYSVKRLEFLDSQCKKFKVGREKKWRNVCVWFHVHHWDEISCGGNAHYGVKFQRLAWVLP